MQRLCLSFPLDIEVSGNSRSIITRFYSVSPPHAVPGKKADYCSIVLQPLLVRVSTYYLLISTRDVLFRTHGLYSGFFTGNGAKIGQKKVNLAQYFEFVNGTGSSFDVFT